MKAKIRWDHELKLWLVTYPHGGISVHDRWESAIRWATETMARRIGFSA